MKKLLLFLLLPLFALAQSGDGIDISLQYAGTLTDPNVPVEQTGIGDEIYIDVVLNNSDPQYTATWADIWFTFNNEAFEYLGVENPLDGQNNWYTNQWPSVYQFNNAQGYPVDDLYNQYSNGSYWTYVGEENSITAPLVITSQSSVELTGVVARLKFKYKPVPNGYDYTDAIIIRKASVRDNNLGYTFTNIKAYPNQIFSNAPISTQLTAKVNIDFPVGIDPTMFIARLYRETTSGNWEQVPGSTTATFDTRGDVDMTPGFNLDDTLAIIIDYVGNDIRALYDEIVTISDVSLAFNELANSGINQDETFNEIDHVMQAINGDVDNNGVFNFDDTYKLLGHVLGNGTYLESDDLVYMLKLYRTDQYDVIDSTNYNNYPHGTTLLLPLVVQNSSQLNYVFNGSITWRGDVNLSHSSIPGNMTEVNTVGKTARPKAFKYNANKEAATINSGMVTELKDGKVVMTLTLNPSSQDVVGTQYKVNYDTSKLSFESVEFNTENTATNFGTPKDGYVKFGSIIQTGDKVLTDKTTYTLIFTPKVNLTNALGLVTVSNTDAVNKTGEQLKLEIQ
jgi:hypothetical protein